ncbi:MAG TPA: fatty acid desaturase [Planctomycetota bacterium]|nr:fatty acid desaturase [Planctomycetota bacterium]
MSNSTAETEHSSGKAPLKKDWINILFLTFTPVLGVPVLAWYTYQVGFQWWMFGLFFALYCLVGLSICAGYHRYFSHKSYDCSPAVQVFYAIFGAMAAQNSILQWSRGHRLHHSYSEQEWDPYSIKRGFWWAHMIWIFYHDQGASRLDNVKDLARNPVVQWQDRWYRSLVIGVGFGLPALIGWYFGDAIAGLLWGGFLRVVFVHHSTFFVNSLAHHTGSPTYDDAATARDNFAVALLTFGEGYHSFHHRFPSDFRNGVRWYHWDPAKWFIKGLSAVGLASNLRATEAPRIEQTRMEVAVKLLEARLARAEPSLGSEIRARIDRTRTAFEGAMALWRKQKEERQQGLAGQWKETQRNYRIRIKQARREWREVLRACERLTNSTETAV